MEQSIVGCLQVLRGSLKPLEGRIAQEWPKAGRDTARLH
jgi:hypothetical protein